MTETEAREVLQVDAAASTAEINRKFEELYNDFQVRLTNAPTAALRTTFATRLSAPQEAHRLLTGGGTRVYEDLPYSAPVHAHDPVPTPVPVPTPKAPILPTQTK